MKQNIYDNESFFNQYEQMRSEEKEKNANDLIEIPNFRSLMPDVKEKSILDLGCGAGESDIYFKSLGAKYVLGTDISENMIDLANKNNKTDGVDYKVLAMEDISSINEKFDIVISSLAFHYIEDFKGLVQSIYEILNDGGYLVFSQEHPFTTCIKFTQNVKKGHTIIDNKYFGLFSDYNRPGERVKEWFGEDVVKYHRNFEEIINTLINEGFTIDKILEPQPSKEAIENNPKYVNQYDRPFFLFVRAKKQRR
jgi:SAM-dependent methyltransferase